MWGRGGIWFYLSVVCASLVIGVVSAGSANASPEKCECYLVQKNGNTWALRKFYSESFTRLFGELDARLKNAVSGDPTISPKISKDELLDAVHFDHLIQRGKEVIQRGEQRIDAQIEKPFGSWNLSLAAGAVVCLSMVKVYLNIFYYPFNAASFWDAMDCIGYATAWFLGGGMALLSPLLNLYYLVPFAYPYATREWRVRMQKNLFRALEDPPKGIREHLQEWVFPTYGRVFLYRDTPQTLYHWFVSEALKRCQNAVRPERTPTF